LDDGADQIARDFISRYEAEWSRGAEAVSLLYASDAVLVGFVTAIGRSEIVKLLRGIIGQGWTKIRIKIVNVRKIGDVILVANEYAAIGSGENAGKTLTATSSHVLVKAAGNGFQRCIRRDEFRSFWGVAVKGAIAAPRQRAFVRENHCVEGFREGEAVGGVKEVGAPAGGAEAAGPAGTEAAEPDGAAAPGWGGAAAIFAVPGWGCAPTSSGSGSRKALRKPTTDCLSDSAETSDAEEEVRPLGGADGAEEATLGSGDADDAGDEDAAGEADDAAEAGGAEKMDGAEEVEEVDGAGKRENDEHPASTGISAIAAATAPKRPRLLRPATGLGTRMR
jgi:hypothetical protein